MLSINYLAIAAAAVVTMALGAIWYSPILFGNAWMRAHGYTKEQLAAMRKGMGRAYAASFVCYLIMAAVLAKLVGWVGVATALEGARLGIVCWLGFAATIGLTANLFSDKPLSAYRIDAGYQFVYLAAMGAIVGGWQ